MIYHFSLQAAAFVAGIILCLLGAAGFVLHAPMQKGAVKFPRSRVAGIVLLAIDLVWSFWLVSTMEMGEFSAFRRPLLSECRSRFFSRSASWMNFWRSRTRDFAFARGRTIAGRGILSL